MHSHKIVFLLAVVGVVYGHPLSLNNRQINDERIAEQSTDAVPEPITKTASKFPKKFNPSKDSTHLPKEHALPVDEEEKQSNGFYKIPLFRQDFRPPTPDQTTDSSLRDVVFYSRYPAEVEEFDSVPEDKDSKSFSKTLRFIMDLLKKRTLEDNMPEEEKLPQPVEGEPATETEDNHSIYT